MKYLLLLTVAIYQKFISWIIKNILGVPRLCNFSPSCSEYARRAILKNGSVRGIKLSIQRLFLCSNIKIL